MIHSLLQSAPVQFFLFPDYHRDIYRSYFYRFSAFDGDLGILGYHLLYCSTVLDPTLHPLAHRS